MADQHHPPHAPPPPPGSSAAIALEHAKSISELDGPSIGPVVEEEETPYQDNIYWAQPIANIDFPSLSRSNTTKTQSPNKPTQPSTTNQQVQQSPKVKPTTTIATPTRRNNEIARPVTPMSSVSGAAATSIAQTVLENQVVQNVVHVTHVTNVYNVTSSTTTTSSSIVNPPAATTPSTTTMSIPLPAYVPVPVLAPTPPPPPVPLANPTPSSPQKATVTIVALGDAWVTKEVYEAEMRRQAEEEARLEAERALDDTSRENAILRRQLLQKTEAAKKAEMDARLALEAHRALEAKVREEERLRKIEAVRRMEEQLEEVKRRELERGSMAMAIAAASAGSSSAVQQHVLGSASGVLPPTYTPQPVNVNVLGSTASVVGPSSVLIQSAGEPLGSNQYIGSRTSVGTTGGYQQQQHQQSYSGGVPTTSPSRPAAPAISPSLHMQMQRELRGGFAQPQQAPVSVVRGIVHQYQQQQKQSQGVQPQSSMSGMQPPLSPSRQLEPQPQANQQRQSITRSQSPGRGGVGSSGTHDHEVDPASDWLVARDPKKDSHGVQQTSESTLMLEDSIEDILDEGRDSKSPISTPLAGAAAAAVSHTRLKDFIPGVGASGSGSMGDLDAKGKAAAAVAHVGKEGSKTGRIVARCFRYLNLARAVASSCYSIYSAVHGLNDPYYQALHARGLMIAIIFFNLVDMIVAFIKAFPKSLWCFWNTREVFSYRLAEVVGNPQARDSITNSKFDWADISSPEYHNFNQLMLYVTSIIYTIMYHALRLTKMLAIDKKAIALALLVLAKAFLLLWDIFTNSLLLYEALVFEGVNVCRLDQTMRLVLSVIVVSPILSLTTNVLINLPLHFTFLRLQLSTRSDPKTGLRGSDVPFFRVLKSALKKTFHPLISAIFGTYVIYAICALTAVLIRLSVFNPLEDIKQGHRPEGIIPSSGFFGWSQSSTPNGTLTSVDNGPSVLLGMIWVNVVANYMFGAITGLFYWIGVVLVQGFLGGVLGFGWLMETWKRFTGAQRAQE
ncbi:hypothetical protein HDU76_004366 [Blyttiomyces sp. JEL0837]|nr:hypothetical protein HDU76_004366 [Blyttiomyces sp. JEL0837]